jgi:hypothetical protein
VWAKPDQSDLLEPLPEPSAVAMAAWPRSHSLRTVHPEFAPLLEAAVRSDSPAPAAIVPPEPQWQHGWPVPSSLTAHPDEARACIYLPTFEPAVIESAQAIAEHFPAAEDEFRVERARGGRTSPAELPHFERVFRLAAGRACCPEVATGADYDQLLILTAWFCVRPGVSGFLGSYPKSLLCPLSHAAPPSELEGLATARRVVFERRAPVYLRYLLVEKLGLRTCVDLENADLRQLLRRAGFRLVRASAVPEFAFAGCTRGDDPAVRPWKLTLRQELSDERAVELLIQAALWQVRFGLRLVSLEWGVPRWNIGAFERTDWEDAFLSLGVRISPSLLRESGALDWRAVLARCVERIGVGNLPAEMLGKVAAVPQRVRHDDHQAIWEVLDQAAGLVVSRVRETEPHLFAASGGWNYSLARSFRRWSRLFDEVSPQILSRLGVSAFTALHRRAPELFGWGPTQLKPWELEQEHGKWKGPRGRALLRSAYAYALHEGGLGHIVGQGDQVIWQCDVSQFSAWLEGRDPDLSAYDFLYRLASRHGLTPLLNREVTHTAAVSLLAGVNLHQNLPRVEGCWDLCLRKALEHHGGQLEVRLALPDFVPLPLRLRKAVMTPLPYAYQHKELRLVRDFDLRMARESHRQLEEIPGWWDDERILGTPLLDRVTDGNDRARAVLLQLNPELWLDPSLPKVRFRALQLLLSARATRRTEPGGEKLSGAEIRVLLELAASATLRWSNVMEISHAPIGRGLERILAREDTREMLDSLLLHIGTAYETETWGQVRKFIVLDAINDLLALTLRLSLLHLLSNE